MDPPSGGEMRNLQLSKSDALIEKHEILKFMFKYFIFLQTYFFESSQSHLIN
jgi:hypothetical protein